MAKTIIPPKGVTFSDFYLYLCHVIDDFACLELQH